MKKIINFLGVATVVVASSMTLVSCAISSGRYSGIYVITDGGKIADKSFNQSGYMAGNKFSQTVLFQNSKREVSYSQPTTMTDAPWMYSQSFKHNAKALVLPGFKHLNYLSTANAGAKLSNGAAIIIDATAADFKNGGMYENTIGLLYRADMSGFWAGISSIMHVLKNTDLTPTLATFGGMQNATAGDPFMAGFLASVKFYNNSVEAGEGTPQKNGIIDIAKAFSNDENTDWMDARRAKIVDNQKDGYIGGSRGNHSQWFTDSYDPGKGSDISETLINTNKANIIMPVAGPQTADTLKVLTENKQKGKSFIVGVDTNQVEMYSTYSDLFITSAEKDIVGSTSLALTHSGVFKEELDKTKIEVGGSEKLNEIIKEMGNNLDVTTKDENNEFKDVAITLSDTDEPSVLEGEPLQWNDWRGHDLWLGGSISTGGQNKVSSKQFQVIKDVLEVGTKKASLDFFDKVTKPNMGIAEVTLSIDTIENYANIVFESMVSKEENKIINKNIETNYGEFLNYGR